MASLDSLCKKHRAARGARRSDREVDQYWLSVVTEEPVPNDLKILVRENLKKLWHFKSEETFREDLRVRWATTDHYRLILKDTIGKVESRTSKYLYNKPTAFYWLNSAQFTDSTGERTLTPKLILAAIFEE
jgi:hypothetical protein